RWLPARGGAGGAGGRGGGAVADMGHPGGWVLRKSYTLAETSEFPAYAPGRAPPCPLESDTHWGPRKTFTKRLAAGRVKSLRGRPARRRTPSSGPPRSPGTPARRWMTVEAGHSGAMAQDQLYYPWGQDWNMVGTAEEKRFASLQHRDSTETGLDPTQFRMLSSTRGRWYSADPVYGRSHNPQSLNRYAYVVNGPSNRIDPFGNQYCDPYSGCGYCDPFDPFGFCAEPVFSGTIRINFFCPDNTCSCCPYYDRLILW